MTKEIGDAQADTFPAGPPRSHENCRSFAPFVGNFRGFCTVARTVDVAGRNFNHPVVKAAFQRLFGSARCAGAADGAGKAVALVGAKRSDHGWGPRFSWPRCRQ